MAKGSKFSPEKKEEISKLWKAIEDGDSELTLDIISRNNFSPDELLDAPEDVVPGEFFTWTALHAAAYYGQLDTLVYILALGADVDKKDTLYGSRPLGWAAYMGHYNVCVDLVRKYYAKAGALNDSGQQAIDLVSDLSSHPWEDILIESRIKRSHKKKVTPQVAAQQTIDKFAKIKARSESRLLTPVRSSPKKLSNASSVSAQNVKTTQPVPGNFFQPPSITNAAMLTPQQQQYAQQMMANRMATLANQQHMSINGQPIRLYIASVGMVSNDDIIRMILPVDGSSPWSGQSLNIEPSVKSLNLRLLLKSSPEEALQYNISITQIMSVSMDYRVKKRSLPVVSSGPTVYDTTSILSEGVNAIEFVVKPVSQVTGLQKPQQTVTVFLNRV